MSAETILTLANGQGIDLRNPRAEDIDWEAFAEQLAKEKRYNGATPDVEYSVAEHSVRGADAALAVTGDRQLAAYFLLHDVHEAVLKDDTTPKKSAIAEECEAQFGILAEHVLTAIRMLELRLDVAIHAAAGLTWPPPPHFIGAIKRWDLVMFVTEWRDLMRDRPHPNWAPYSGILPLEETITPWRWQTARGAFMNRCRDLLPAFALAHNKTPREHGGASA